MAIVLQLRVHRVLLLSKMLSHQAQTVEIYETFAKLISVLVY